MGKHTPGPWKARCNFFSRWEIHYADGQLASVSKPDDPASPPDSWPASEANARLIAAAPDLLEALIAILPDAEANHVGGPDTGARIDVARSAIAKATGAP